MWYDLYPGVPPRGSPLETLFIHVNIARKEADLLATRTLARGQFALLSKSPESAKAAFEAYESYTSSMFPFLERASTMTVDDNSRLLEHVKYPMQIDVASIRYDRAEQAKSKALRKFKAVQR